MPHSMTLPDKLVNTKISGFDFLEISIDETDEKLSRLYWSEHERKILKNAVIETGVTPGSMCLSGHRKYPLGSMDEKTRKKSFDIMTIAIDFASELGIRIIQLAGYDVYYEKSNDKTRSYFQENLAKSVTIAAKNGVYLAFETMETPFMDTVEKAMFYINEINSPYLQIYPDLGNLTNAAILYNHDIKDDIKTGHGHITAMHLKETAHGKYRDIPYGTGQVDFQSGIEAVWKQGVRRFVGEFWDNGDFQTQINHAYTFLSGFLDETEKKEKEKQ